MPARSRFLPNAGAPEASTIKRLGALIITTPSTKPARRRSSSVISSRSSIGPIFTSKGSDPTAARAAAAMQAASSVSRYTSLSRWPTFGHEKFNSTTCAPASRASAASSAEVVDDFCFGRVGVSGADHRHDHDLPGPQQRAATPDVSPPDFGRTRRHADRSRRGCSEWRGGDAVDDRQRRRGAARRNTSLVQIEPVRQWVCQPRTAPYGLVGQQIEPESAVKLEPSFVHQQARRDTDARRNSVTEKVLHRRCRYVDIRTSEGWSFGRVLLERPIEPIDRRHDGRRDRGRRGLDLARNIQAGISLKRRETMRRWLPAVSPSSIAESAQHLHGGRIIDSKTSAVQWPRTRLSGWCWHCRHMLCALVAASRIRCHAP